MHGGVIFALADAVFAAASNSREVVSVATHVSIDFLRAPRAGEELTATCRENLLARKVGHYAMEVAAGQRGGHRRMPGVGISHLADAPGRKE